MPTLVRFLGGNYTGEYRDIKNTIKILRESKCDDIIVNELKGTLETGCLNKINSTSTCENSLLFGDMVIIHQSRKN